MIAKGSVLPPRSAQQMREALSRVLAIASDGERSHTHRILSIAALVVNDDADLPAGADLVQLARSVGVSQSSAYLALRTERSVDPGAEK